MADRQISAVVSEGTGELLDAYSRASGTKKGYLIESALLHHLEALRELPDDVIIPPRLVLSDAGFDAMLEAIEHPPRPTKAMRQLMSER